MNFAASSNKLQADPLVLNPFLVFNVIIIKGSFEFDFLSCS